MYFKKLELVGFKSFCNKTTLNFEPGVTAVVGPNGCGKSNIFDSIRWVLGEQSVKALRGSEMQDVIFNGTDSKEALSMAEVTLTFDNDKKYFPVEHNEVAITRRLYRSGESEYLLNKQVVRLKDVLDLLMGTGIGAESYSLVAQGKIDLILSSRPEDRRMVFDEASGITKYKAQKKETMRKLEETDQNLLRVNDIITEVKRQIGSLERQANKARRYKEAFEEIKTKEMNLGTWQRWQLLAQKTQISEELAQLGTKETVLLNNISHQEAQIAGRQEELRLLENKIVATHNEILSLENDKKTSKEHIEFNKKRISELETSQIHLVEQIEQTRLRLIEDEEKLNKVKAEQEIIKQNIEEKNIVLKTKEEDLILLNLSVKSALDAITGHKKDVLDIVVSISNVRNQITELTSKEQVAIARQKRLDLEKLKIREESSTAEATLQGINQELSACENELQDMSVKIATLQAESKQDLMALEELQHRIEQLEKEVLTLQSQKEFLELLKTKYDTIGESMNAVIELDKVPADDISGLVIKIKSIDPQNSKVHGEAKPIDLDTRRINELIAQIETQILELRNIKTNKETHIQEASLSFEKLQENRRSQEIIFVNKKTSHEGLTEQYNKIKQEEEIVLLELTDVDTEISSLSDRAIGFKLQLVELEDKHKLLEETISKYQADIAGYSNTKELLVIEIAETKAAVEALSKQIISDLETIKILEEAYSQDKSRLAEIERLTIEAADRKNSLEQESLDLGQRIVEAEAGINEKNSLLIVTEDKARELAQGLTETAKIIDGYRKELDSLKDKLYELQMNNKDTEFKLQSLKDRLLQSYRINLDTLELTVPETEPIDANSISNEIAKLKEKLDSYGSVNLVAIEEYDELKKRYDFLTQQQTDLVTAKDSLHQAILKINRTTKQMFMETFDKIKEEFRTYFRLLFNGGDAQVFLVDEQDPLESGIEIICRPPGKKLQNVLLLSGGEKSMSAIALIFAIFKVKPSPFCVLDEIDAALDEANVDRFGKILQEFIKQSQFIVITHNKKTIANADVMYGITMEQSGVSKIVSVKFTHPKSKQRSEPDDIAVAA